MIFTFYFLIIYLILGLTLKKSPLHRGGYIWNPNRFTRAQHNSLGTVVYIELNAK